MLEAFRLTGCGAGSGWPGPSAGGAFAMAVTRRVECRGSVIKNYLTSRRILLLFMVVMRRVLVLLGIVSTRWGFVWNGTRLSRLRLPRSVGTGRESFRIQDKTGNLWQ
jgi:hypothetical protein